MSEPKYLLLKTQLYQQTDKTTPLDCLEELDQSSIFVVNPTTMQVADWDQVLQEILDHDRCLTL